ncbi:Phosphatidyl-N-methylethanolamine N-methyltransferase [Blastocladiella emersonii ATCC 22665]|nr:Phosphatidyl-N-methylethanolamine N-methyltransferase [Blastocladiella emersonii ATCC 22665]
MSSPLLASVTDLATTLSTAVDWSQPSLSIAAGSVAFNPTFWNIVARAEHRSQILTRLAGGSALAGCYALAATIFSLGILRDYLYAAALDDQPVVAMLACDTVRVAGAAMLAVGNVFVLSSMWRLGVTGTYLGDYFGILMEQRVTEFPFNVMENPMYTGSTMCFVGTALWKGSFAGLVLSVWVWIVYQLALAYEGPFTAQIYAKRDELRRKQKQE